MNNTSMILGTYGVAEWAYITLFGLMGALAYKLISYKNTGKNSQFSPSTFDVKYWIADRGNWNDLLLGFILFFFIVRFKFEVLAAFPDNPFVVFIAPFVNSPFFYPCVGFLMTFIIKRLRQWTQIQSKVKT